MSDIIPMQPRRSREHTHLILQRCVRHAVDSAIQPRLALPEQRGAKDYCKVLHGHLVLRLMLDDSIGGAMGRAMREKVRESVQSAAVITEKSAIELALGGGRLTCAGGP